MLEQLSTLAAELPWRELKPGLAGHVRRRLGRNIGHPGFGSRPLALATAGGLVFVFGLWVAFQLGLRSGITEVGRGADLQGESIAVHRDRADLPGRVMEPFAEVDGVLVLVPAVADEGPGGDGQPSTIEEQHLVAGSGQPPVFLKTDRDVDAVRAARTIFADLPLLDSVPEDLRQPMMAAQVQYFGLGEWARSLPREARAHPAIAVADLVMDLERAIARDLPPATISELNAIAATPSLWNYGDLGEGLVSVPGVAPSERNMALTLDTFAADMNQEARSSLEEWLRFKEDRLTGGQDLDGMVGLLEALGARPDGGMGRGSLALPNLDELWSQLRWTDRPDGSRHGQVHVEKTSENGSSSYRLEVHTDGDGSSFSSSSSSSSKSSSWSDE